MIKNATKSAISLIHKTNVNLTQTCSHKSNNYPFAFFSSSYIITPTEKPTSSENNPTYLNDAVTSFHAKIRKNPQPPLHQYAKLLTSITKIKHFSVALNLFDEMRQRNLPVNTYILNIAINCYVNLNQTGFAFAMLATFYKTGHVPVPDTFNILLLGLFAQGNPNEAHTLFRKLLKLKLYEPDRILVSTVVKGLCKNGHRGKARDLIEMLEYQGYELGRRVYNDVIDSLCKDGMVDQARKLMYRMVEKGISLNDFTYGAMISGYCGLGRWEEGKELFNEMEVSKVTPTLMTCNILLKCLCESRRIDEAFNVLCTMEESYGIAPDVITCAVLVKGLCLDGKVDAALKVLEGLPETGLTPDVWTFTTIISALCRERRVKEANDLFMDMKTKGRCVPDSMTYNVLLRGFLTANEDRMAVSLLEEMTNKGFSPDKINASILVKFS